MHERAKVLGALVHLVGRDMRELRELADAGLRDEDEQRLSRALSTTNVAMRRIDR